MKAIEPTRLRRGSRRPSPHPRNLRGPGDQALMRLKGRLLRRLTAETDNPVLHAGLRRAAAEAESLAWLSQYPLLVLPLLLEEKAREARRYATRQAELREASREWQSLAE